MEKPQSSCIKNQLKVESEDRDEQIKNCTRCGLLKFYGQKHFLGGSKWVSILLGRRKEFMVNKTKVSGGLKFLEKKRKKEKKLQELRNSLESDRWLRG